jgi:hypothetical protein
MDPEPYLEMALATVMMFGKNMKRFNSIVG